MPCAARTLLTHVPVLSAQAELKTLLASKTKVIKETEIRKASLEQLEKQLDDFVASAKAIQEKFSRMQ